MSGSAIDESIRQLRDPDPDVRCEAAGTLGAFGRDGVSAIAPLFEACRDEDRYVRGEAAHSLWELACSCVGAVPGAESHFAAGLSTLIELLDDPESDVRCSALAVLTALGPLASPALPRALALLVIEDQEIRDEAKRAIRAIMGTS